MYSTHFISGLPRSGSTLLSALLRQNPRFRAGITTPVASLVNSMQRQISTGEYASCFDDDRRKRLLLGVFAGFYGEDVPPEGGGLFDTNRSWTARLSLLDRLFPDCRVICCVREVGWILDSLEAIFNRHPLSLSKVNDFDASHSVYSRAERLMNSENGLVGRPWASLREAWYGNLASRLIVVPYERLVAAPGETLAKLYAALDEPMFAHNLTSVSFDAPGYDSELGLPGLHKIEGKVAVRDRICSLPPDMMRKYAGASFWSATAPNPNRVLVL